MRYKWFNKNQPDCKDDLLKTIAMMEGTLRALQFKRTPDEWLLNMLLQRVSSYKSLLPSQKMVERKTSLLFPEFNK